MCGGRVSVRRAAPGDAAARAAVLHDAVASHFIDIFLYFYFQELTLQCVVLGGAVLFIFCGASVATCALLPAAAALGVAGGAWAAGAERAARAAARLGAEDAGWVAAAGGRVLATASLHRTAPGAARLRDLAVSRAARRRGLAAALLGAAREHAQADGLVQLEAHVSHLAGAARAALHRAGWRLRAAGVRPVAAGLLDLPVALFALDLPSA